MDQTIAAITAQVALAECINTLANKALRPGAVVIDLGAGDGAWTRAAMASVADLSVHCFEPDPEKYRRLLINLSSQISAGHVIPHNASCGWVNEHSVKSWGSIQDYAKQAGLNRLQFVRLNAGVPISAATDGCGDLVRRGYIEFILSPANTEEEAALGSVILPGRYEMFRHPALGDQVLCVSDRFRASIRNEPPRMPSLLERCREFNIAPRGVIVIGAHEGSDAESYQRAGVAKSLLVEANPAVYDRLKSNTTGLDGVVAVHCAATDFDGRVDLHVTSFDQSSSILPLARHSEIYPSITEVAVIEVPARTVDRIVEDAGHNAADYNLMHLDIQGAELLALKGAIGMLPNVLAILTEVSYEQMYTGCAQIEQMDAFLEAQGFDRVATAAPYHSSRAGAFYIRRRSAPVSQKAVSDFLYNARNTIVGGWLSIPAISLREAWEGATGHAHRHLIDNGVHQLPLSGEDDSRVLQLLRDSLKSASKDRRLQLLLALMLYGPASEIKFAPESVPGWLKKSLPVPGNERTAMAA
jgi:FkbM family methyltransferase